MEEVGRRGQGFPAFFLAITVLMAITSPVQAVDYAWGGGDGNWSDANWTPGPVSGPTANSDTATINGGSVSLNVGGMNVGSLTLGTGGTFNAYNWNGTNTYTGYGNLLLQGGVINGIGNYHNWGAGILVNTTVSGSSASTISASSFFNLNGTGVSSSVFTVADVTGDANPDLNVSAQLWDISADNTWVPAALVKEGPGTMRLTAYNGYTGGTTINGGTLDVSGATSGTGWLRGSVTVNPGAAMTITGGDGTGFGWNNPVTSLTINGGTVNASGGAHVGFGPYATVALNDGGTIAGSWQWNGDSLLGFSSSGNSTNTIAGNLNLRDDAGANHTFNVANGMAVVDLQVNANLTDLTSSIPDRRGGVVKAGAGTMVLAGNNTYAGQTDIQVGTLIAASNTALGPGGHDGNTMSWIRDGATLALQGGVSLDEHFHVWGAGVDGLGAVRSLSGNNALTNAPGGGPGYALRSNTTVGVDADTLTVSGFYNGDAGSYPISKVGAGTLVLSGESNHTGGTTVEAGTLLVNGVHVAGLITVSAATFGGAGQVGDVDLGPNGMLAPGDTARGDNWLQMSALSSLYSSARLNFELGTPDIAGGALAANDLIIAVSLPYSRGQVNVIPQDGFASASPGSKWPLIQLTGGAIPTDHELVLDPALAGQYTLQALEGDNVLYLVAVPEAGTAGLFGMALLILRLIRRTKTIS